MIRGQATMAVLADLRLIDQRTKIVVAQRSDLVKFMRGPKAVKEMKERDARFEGGSLRDEGKITRLLHRAGAE
jgi:hypothetical protein